MKIGDIVVFIEDYHFNNKFYPKGTRMTITGDCGWFIVAQRGWNLSDGNGNTIAETIFISDKYRLLSDIRNDKLNELGI
jgi:hypothetical protein